jgi:DNA polymerase-3 subunit gamma/tau
VHELCPSHLAARCASKEDVSYLVLARKYRPQSFEDLVGQEHVAQTLAHAIEQSRVAHAFLFTGVRGVGKTTSARLLAKCLNCLGPDGKATTPTATPCNQCSACTEITAGQDMDVQEIDGASYGGVDEVRRLQEGIAFRPARDRYKIYIVDEVHMLSQAAWNAFLKTLEEPPPHVKFIFATTEVHKVPVTILSRCQRYDFKLIPTQTIAKRLKEVLAKESIEAEDSAIAVIAREAAGSMRDAMSLLDQVIAFSGKKMTSEDVSRVLGVADRRVLHDLAAAIIDGDAAKVLSLIDDLATQGFDLGHVAKDLLLHLRHLVVAKVSPAARELLDLADEEAAEVGSLAQRAEMDDLLRLFHGLNMAFDDVLKSGQLRAALEMTLVRLSRRPPLRPIDDLLVRLGELEKRLGGAPTPPSRGGGGSSPRARPSIEPGPSFGSHTAPTVIDRSTDTGTRASAAPLLRPEESTPLPPSAEQQKAPVVQLVPPATGGALDRFRTIVEAIRRTRPHVASLLAHAYVIQIDEEKLRLGFEPGHFAPSQLNDPHERAVIEREARAVLGTKVEITIESDVRPTSTSATLAAIDREKQDAERARARKDVEQHPMVKTVIELFGAEIREIKIPDQK